MKSSTGTALLTADPIRNSVNSRRHRQGFYSGYAVEGFASRTMLIEKRIHGGPGIRGRGQGNEMALPTSARRSTSVAHLGCSVVRFK